MKLKLLVLCFFIFPFGLTFNVSTASAQTVFRFGVWADTKGGLSTLSSDSNSMVGKNPVFLLYPGDVCDSGPTTSCLTTWRTSYDKGGNLFNKSFFSRGNHDSSGTSVWTSYFNVAGTIASIPGITNLSQLSTNLSFSFDYGNSHFVMIDMPGGDATTISTAQLTWLDNDLTAAEARGITHSFLFWHGPEYPMGGHCCTNATSIPPILNKHQSVSATFHGHEHNLAYAHMDSTKISSITHPYEEFTSGGGGAGLYGCERGDWCSSSYGYIIVDVNGNSFTVTVYNSSGGSLKSWTFTKTGGSTPTQISLKGDTNGDGHVNITDLLTWINHYGQAMFGSTAGDFTGDGEVNVLDFAWIALNYGK